MAIAPTGAIYKALSFDGTSSRNYGVYITGEAVYNAPERDVEMITIPGRNGTFAMDKGRFENITVSYPASIAASTEADYRQALSDFRNFLCSKKGYVRLSDDYNPNEYRMAVYKSGLEVTTAQLRAGEFDIVFECKPQRFLTSGETAVTVANNGTLTNPTAFDASPLLEVDGYGDITINGEALTIDDAFIGDIAVTSGNDQISSTSKASTTLSVEIDAKDYNTGDLLHGADALIFTIQAGTKMVSPAKYGAVNWGPISLGFNNPCYIGTSNTATWTDTENNMSVINANNQVIGTYNATITAALNYDGVRTVSCTVTLAYTGAGAQYVSAKNASIRLKQLFVDSTVRAVSNKMFIDLDIGEAWSEDGGVITPLNNVVYLGAELPKLKSGANAFTKSNTVTQLKVTPRWWKV